MIDVYAHHNPSGTTLLVISGHVPETLCAWFTGFSDALGALYGGRPSRGSGFFLKSIPTDDAKLLLAMLRTVAGKYPEYVVISEKP